MKVALTLALALIVIFITGCGTYDVLRDTNRVNITRIDKGMTKSQVYEIMGSGTATGSAGTIANPYKRELIKDRAGNEHEVLYYYTERIGDKDWENGMTPIALRDGRVVGIGWRYLESSDLNVTIRRR